MMRAFALLRADTNPGTATDLLVLETVRRAIDLANVEARRLLAGRAASDDDSIAPLQGFASHADFDKLPAVIHLEPPLLRAAAAILDFHRHERMRINEMKLRDNTFNGYLPRTVINARDRMMRLCRHDGGRDSGSERQNPSFHEAK